MQEKKEKGWPPAWLGHSSYILSTFFSHRTLLNLTKCMVNVWHIVTRQLSRSVWTLELFAPCRTGFRLSERQARKNWALEICVQFVWPLDDILNILKTDGDISVTLTYIYCKMTRLQILCFWKTGTRTIWATIQWNLGIKTTQGTVVAAII